MKKTKRPKIITKGRLVKFRALFAPRKISKLTPAEYRRRQIKQTKTLKLKRVALRRKQKAEKRSNQ